MKTSKLALKIGLAATLSLAVTLPASATIAFTTPAQGNNFPNSKFYANVPGTASYNLGLEFTVGATAIFVNKMGAFDNGAQGFPTAVNVAIYKTDGTMVAGTLMNFPVGYTAGEYVGNTEFRPITPVQLNANTTYRIVAGDYWQLGVTPGSRYFDENLDTGPIQPAGNVTLGFNGAGLITLGGNYYATGTIGGPNPLTWTGTDPTTGGGPRFAAGSFDFTPVPEASQFAVAGVGLLGLVYIGRCAWQRRKSLA